MSTNRPPDHDLRESLYEEAHARPSERMRAPLQMSYLALLGLDRDAEIRHLGALAGRCGARPPAPGASHYGADFGGFRLVWERHTEFSRYLFIVPAGPSDPFAQPALDAVPADWRMGLGGRTFVAMHVALLQAPPGEIDLDDVGQRFFGGNMLVGANIAYRAAVALADFRIREDGFSRMVVFDRGMPSRQAGRMLQRLFEIDTYRILALFAFPVAREMNPTLERHETELARITAQLAESGDLDEAALLDRLTRLQAAIESREAAVNFRFAASGAYYELVRARILEMREERVPGLLTFQEFTDRRLAPAMNTCRSVMRRLESLSQRTARATGLLSTRVGVSREHQNQALLASMDQRAAAQLRLQQTVEGLSIAAITYYIVGLVSYAAKGALEAGLPIEPGLVTALSIPVVVTVVALGIRRIRRSLDHSRD